MSLPLSIDELWRLPLLPWRLLGASLEILWQSVQAAGQRPPEPSLPPVRREVERTCEPAARWPVWGEGMRAEGGGAPEPSGAPPPGFASFAGGAVHDGVAVLHSDVQTKEDRPMTCCDQSLSGCELKIVSYSIVSVDPEIDFDADRIILPSQTIATSSDMTPADFTAYVIASQRGEHRERLERYDPEYLRVCFSVTCRLPLPCLDYEKEQAQALRSINRTLREKGHLPAGPSQELAPAEPRRGGARQAGRE